MIAYLNTFVLQYRVISVDIFQIVYDFTNISTIALMIFQNVPYKRCRQMYEYFHESLYVPTILPP